MKILTFDGNLVKDAEVKQTAKGTDYLTFRVGNTSYIRGENKTEFIQVTSLNVNHIKLAEHLLKGRRVLVMGTYDSEVSQGKDGRLYINSNVLANHIEFFGGSGKNDENTGAASTGEPSIAVTAAPTVDDNEIEAKVEAAASVSAPTVPADASDDDDLPF